MTIDDALIVRNILNDNWNAGNVAKPILYYKDDIKNHDYRKDAIKVYVRSGPIKTPSGLGYMGENVVAGVSVDIRSADRDRCLLVRDEAERCLKSSRKTPDSYDLITDFTGRWVSGYAGFWHYVLDINLRKYSRSIST